MVAYGIAKARAMANRTDDEEFTAWVEENAEDLAKADTEENETIFVGIDRIDFKENYIDDDALF